MKSSNRSVHAEVRKMWLLRRSHRSRTILREKRVVVDAPRVDRTERSHDRAAGLTPYQPHVEPRHVSTSSAESMPRREPAYAARSSRGWHAVRPNMQCFLKGRERISARTAERSTRKPALSPLVSGTKFAVGVPGDRSIEPPNRASFPSILCPPAKMITEARWPGRLISSSRLAPPPAAAGGVGGECSCACVGARRTADVLYCVGEGFLSTAES